MSGGGGGGGDDWRVLSGGGGGEEKCAIVERTVLNSPVASIVAGLEVGTILQVELETQPRNRLVTATAAGEIAGAFTSPKLVEFIECIQDGFSYEAEVKSISGGRVEIEIRPA
ncbi:MAG: hypothetical protein OXR62_09255 [Ahrensia sp.]|nr:hypothetical protein [Ahrensia sp.]